MFTGVICSHYDDVVRPAKLYYFVYGSMRAEVPFTAWYWGSSLHRWNFHVDTVLQIRRYKRFAMKLAFKESIGTRLNDEVIAHIFTLVYGYYDY